MKEKLLKELKECLENIIENSPIESAGQYTKRCGCMYFVIVLGKHIYVNDKITEEDTKFILNNINNITYIYNDSTDEDTIIGNTDEVLEKFNITSLQYICFVKHFNGSFTANDFYKFMNRKRFYV